MTDPTRGARILVVDDERAIRRTLEINLRAHGYEVDVASDGTEALRQAADHRPDAVILDLGLPRLGGRAVIEGLRGWTDVPIIVLSARDDEAEKVTALDAGADDYVTKPFGMNELLARVRAAVRRHAPVDTATPALMTDDFTVDFVGHRVSRNGVEVKLTPTEWHLVEALTRAPGRLITQRQLLQEVWGPDYGTETNYLRVFMAQIRRKLEPDPSAPRYFLTEPGVGYRFER